MSDSEDSTVTYTEVSSLFEDLSNIGSPGVDGLPMMLEDPYVEAALQALPSPDYVPCPEHPPSPDFVPEPVYPEFMPPEDDEDLEEDDEDPKEDPVDYPEDRDDDKEEEESSGDDADDDEEDEDEDKEEEHLAPSNSVPPPAYYTIWEYDIWAIKMEHYLAHTDYPIWEVIQNGNCPVSITTDTSGQIMVLPPRTAEEIIAREREKKARTTLLMALPEDHLAKFHKMTDAKEMWDAIKSRFGGNDESKKMQNLLSQLEIHEAGVSTEDAHQKFLRSLPSAWSQVSLIMRNKPGVDTLSFDDLYNNLRVFECDIKGSTASYFGQQNVAFVSENTSSTNDVSTTYYVPNPSGQNSMYEQTSSYSLLANQSSCPQLDHEDLEQIDEYDLEEMDLKWQVAMISMRMKKFYKKTGRKLQFDAKVPVGFDKTKVECYNCHKTGHFARECRIKGTQDNRRRDAWNSGNKDGSRTGKKEDSKALVTVDGEGVDWSNHLEDEDYALVTEVNSCSTKCKESYANLKKLYDAQREQLSDASIEIKAYS
ncbi:ribonuclease H-like domain-containing protein [Tanacetum coccineum]